MIIRRAKPANSKVPFRRVRALLASGLVLGVGAAITLAAWNDYEHGAATFTAGHFEIHGSIDGVGFGEHSTAEDAATLPFNLPESSAMVPGTTVYALYSVRTASGSVPGSVQLAAKPGNSAGLGASLSYGVRTIPGTTCNASTFAESSADVVALGSALTVGAAASQALAQNASAQVNYCFAVTLSPTAPNSAQGTSVTANWEFVGTTGS